MFLSSYSTQDANTDRTFTSRDRSLPSQDVHTSEVEDQTSQSSAPESVKPSREQLLDFTRSVGGISQTIFDLMKSRVKDRKAVEEGTAFSQLQDSDYRHKQDVAQHLTADVEAVGRSGHEWSGSFQGTPSLSSILQRHLSQAGDVHQDEHQHRPWNVDEHGIPGARSAYSYPPSSNSPLVHHSYQSQTATGTNNRSSDVSLSNEVQWLDSWTHDSEPQDIDLRNYGIRR